MLRARREARQGAGAQQEPRFAQSDGRSRYRGRRQYGPPQDQYGYRQQQQYDQPQQYGQHYVSPELQWPQQLINPSQMYGSPQQYWGQQPPAASLSGLSTGNESAAQQSETYAPTQLLQLPPHQSNGPRPCVIPQITHKRFSGENMSPFVRVRVPELEHQISSHELIVFIDELNEAFLANPALQTANNVANVGGMAPSMIVQMVSVGVNVAAGVGSSVTTKVRTKKYLAKTNEELFHPKGLHVQICKTDKMLEYVGLGGQENVFVRQQYKNVLENAQHVPDNVAEGSNHPIMQRMNSLGNRVMSLSFNNVEEATMPDGFWKKWGAKEASKAEQKQIEKMIKDQAKEDRRSGRMGGRGTSRRQERQEGKKAKEANKILWVVITAKTETIEGDEQWDSESESLGSHKH